MKQRSYIKNSFIRMFLILILLVLTLGIAFLEYSKRVVSEEVINLNQAILGEAVQRTAQTINNISTIGYNLSRDSHVIRWMSENGEKGNEKELLADMESRILEHIWMNYQEGNTVAIHMFKDGQLKYTSSKQRQQWEQVEQVFSPDKEPNQYGSWWLAAPVSDSESYGLYRYMFWIMYPIEEMVSRERHGYILISASEKALYETFSPLNSSKRQLYLLNQDGVIISAGDKRRIGEKDSFAEIGFSGDRGFQMYGDRNEKIILYEKIQSTQWYLLEEISADAAIQSMRPIQYFMSLLLGISIFLLFCIYQVSLSKISKPVNDIKDKMNQLAHGNLKVRIREKTEDEFGEIAESFNYMADKINDLMLEVKEGERKKRLIELDFLQAQINPHFIYNTLSSIRFYVEMEKNEEAEEMLIDFARILRTTLSRSSEFILLKDEIETIKNYVDLQKARYRDRFKTEFSISPETENCQILNFILQPIVENAIFYSLAADRMAYIKISSYIEKDILNLEISDNGIGMNEEQLEAAFDKEMSMNKVGVKNVHERLQLNYGLDYGLSITSEYQVGTTVILHIPVMKGDAGSEGFDC